MYNLIKKSMGLMLLMIFLTSCLSYEEVEIKDVKSIKLLDFSQKSLTVESEIKIHNPNNFSLSVVDSEFEVFIKGKRIGKARINSKLKIPANSSNYHTLLLISDNKDMSPNALPTLISITVMGKDEIDFEVKGYIVGKTFLFRKKVEVSHRGMVPLKFY